MWIAESVGVPLVRKCKTPLFFSSSIERRDSGEGPGSVRILLVVLRHRDDRGRPRHRHRKPRLCLRAAADGLRHQQQRLQRRKPLPRPHVRPPQRRNRHRGLLPLHSQDGEGVQVQCDEQGSQSNIVGRHTDRVGTG